MYFYILNQDGSRIMVAVTIQTMAWHVDLVGSPIVFTLPLEEQCPTGT